MTRDEMVLFFISIIGISSIVIVIFRYYNEKVCP